MVTASVFSNLFAKIYSNKRFSTLLMMVIESESKCSLLLIPDIYAIVLESLARIFVRLAANEKRPIENKKLFTHRNDLLHGSILLTEDEGLSDCEINNYMQYASGRRYTLINYLIIKCICFSGYMINYAKFDKNDVTSGLMKVFTG